MTLVAVTVFPCLVPRTRTRAPDVTMLDDALVRPLKYVVDDCSSTVTACPDRSVTVKLVLEALLTVPATPSVPANGPDPAKGPPELDPPDVDPPVRGAAPPTGALVAAGAEFDVANANDSPTTARTSTPATIHASVALRNGPPDPRSGGVDGGWGQPGHP